MEAFATVDEYRLDSGDAETASDRVEAVLLQQSAKLYTVAGGIDRFNALASRWSEGKRDTVRTLARMLVTDAARKQLSAASIEGIESTDGLSQTSFTANGFQASYSFANPSGAAYFDRDTLADFKRAVGRAQMVGNMLPSYGGR